MEAAADAAGPAAADAPSADAADAPDLPIGTTRGPADPPPPAPPTPRRCSSRRLALAVFSAYPALVGSSSTARSYASSAGLNSRFFISASPLRAWPLGHALLMRTHFFASTRAASASLFMRCAPLRLEK